MRQWLSLASASWMQMPWRHVKMYRRLSRKDKNASPNLSIDVCGIKMRDHDFGKKYKNEKHSCFSYIFLDRLV